MDHGDGGTDSQRHVSAETLTIIGIPLGVASFKMIPLALVPFGKEIVKAGQVGPGDNVAAAVPS
jgi:uncharacterized membrane protein YccF (DUF307 family)